MTQVTQEEMGTALANQKTELLAVFSSMVGRIQSLKESEDGARFASSDIHRVFEEAKAATASGNTELKTVFFNHISRIEEKVAAMTVDIAEVKLKQLTSMHAPEASAFATQHLTRRKGFDGIPAYGGGVQWKEWRFSTVHWLSQEHKQFEDFLQKSSG